MAALPSGTVTFLFADLEGSARSGCSPSVWPCSPKWKKSLASTPRPVSSARAASMSVTIRCVPCSDPGDSLGGAMIVIEHAEPGGVICTTRNSGPARWSTSSWKPHCSM